MNRKILVVDDDSFIRECCTEMLINAGYSVDTASDGIEGLERLTKGVYDMVVSDITMPRLNGIGLYLKIEKEHPYLSNRFLFITGVAPTDNESAELLSRKQSSILIKPFEPATLLKKVALLTLLPLSEHFRAPGNDLRRHERFPYASECIVFPNGHPVNGIEAKTLDISRSGICVRYPGPGLGMLRKIALRLKNQAVDKKGLIRWSRDLNGLTTSGVEIDDAFDLSSFQKQKEGD